MLNEKLINKLLKKIAILEALERKTLSNEHERKIQILDELIETRSKLIPLL